MLVFPDVNCAIYVDRNSITHGGKEFRKFCLPYVMNFNAKLI